jgi:hypothetical protein
VAIALASPRALHSRADGESAFVRVAAPALQIDQLLPSFVEDDPRWSPSLAFRPHARRSGLELLDLWGKARTTTLAGHFAPERLVIPLLDEPPWRLIPGETRGTPRISVPAGLFEARVIGSVAPRGEGRFVRFVASRDEEDFTRAFLGSDEPEPRLLLLLPEGARRLEIWATGLQAGASIDAILLRPLRLGGPAAATAPRAARGD